MPTPATLKQFSGGGSEREMVSFAHPEFEGHQVISESRGDAKKWLEEYYDSKRNDMKNNRKRKKQGGAETLQPSPGGK